MTAIQIILGSFGRRIIAGTKRLFLFHPLLCRPVLIDAYAAGFALPNFYSSAKGDNIFNI